MATLELPQAMTRTVLRRRFGPQLGETSVRELAQEIAKAFEPFVRTPPEPADYQHISIKGVDHED